jgi:hypothetical protein
MTMVVRARIAAGVLAALLCAASALGCHQVIELPPSQVPRLVTARGAEVEVMDHEGDTVTVRRGEVDEVRLLAANERRLLTYGGPLSGAGGVNVISVAEEHDAEMQDRGWTRTRPFQGPVDMRVHGELLTVAGHGRVYTWGWAWPSPRRCSPRWRWGCKTSRCGDASMWVGRCGHAWPLRPAPV